MTTTRAPSHLSHPSYRPDIDGLRAVAVLSVVGFHAFPMWMRGGFIGVDIFFVISGFLISSVIFESLERGTFSFAEFYARRIRRIFPALVLVLAACYVMGWFALLPAEYAQLGKHIAAGAGFISNIVFWGEAGYFDNAAETKPLLHLWSLGIEEQFYIVWPLLVWAAWRRRLNLLTLAVVLVFLSFALNVREVGRDAVATFYAPHTRVWELLCGSVLAWLALYGKGLGAGLRRWIDGWLVRIVYRQPAEADGRTLSSVLALVGGGLLAWGFWRISKEVAFPGVWALVPVLGAVAIIAAGPRAWVNRVVLSNRVAVWFGLISYPLYLWHWPLLSLARIVEGGVPGRTIRIGAVVLSVLLAWLTYRWLERPMRTAVRGRLKVVALVALMVVVGYTGYNAYQRDGLPFRLKQMRQVAELLSRPPPGSGEEMIWCQERFPELSRLLPEVTGGCALSAPSAPTVAFIGDSHAGHYLVDGIEQVFHDDVLMGMGYVRCLPFAHAEFMTGGCQQAFSGVLDFLENQPSIKMVIIAGYWSYLMAGDIEAQGDNWRILRQPTAAQIASFKDNATQFLSRVLASGKRVILLRDVPDLGFDVRQCFDVRPLRLTPTQRVRDCWIDEGAYRQRVRRVEQALDELLAQLPAVETFDPRPLLCRDGRCHASDGQLPYYFDGDHLNPHGARMVLNALGEQRFRRP